MLTFFERFFIDEEAEDIVEYALLLVLVAIAIAIASPNISTAIIAVFSRIGSYLNGTPTP